MSVSFEGKLGILLGLLSLAGAGAIMIAPEKLWIGWSLIVLAAAGAIALGFHHLGRRFVAVPIGACVVWWDYWYYSSVLSRRYEQVQTAYSTPSSMASGSPSPSPGSMTPKIASTLARMILACDSPKPAKPLSLTRRRADLAERLELLQKMYGFSVTGNVTENELTLSTVVNQPFGSMKQSWLIKRVDDKIFVSIRNAPMEENALTLVFAIVSLAPLDPNEEMAKQVQQKVAELVNVDATKCKLL
ncbi:hypothetical protein [Bradyrhizobium sp. SZCCHNR3015]|uniref:hypothetical protein n=1 Tax=Bradyrhizobium sp. SZCCHNR3015 TaxID=3057395 RepID=UPI0029166CBD|nr:hypothetical protein [Bradyrhizobium sp. SZCCHNR3015]